MGINYDIRIRHIINIDGKRKEFILNNRQVIYI